MKKIIYILFLLTFGILKAQYTQIPDPYFEGVLINYGYDNVYDGRVLTANIENVTSLGLTYEFITDLTGIQDFTALEELYLQDNYLTSIDLSQNTNLKILILTRNYIETLDLTGNPNLEVLECVSQQHVGEFYLTNVDISQCYNLVHLDLSNNGILTDVIDVSNSPNLEYINVGGANIVGIDLTNNPNLEYIYVGGTYITSLDLSQNVSVKELELSSIPYLDYIDLSQNINLEKLVLSGASSNLTELDLSNNINLKFFRISQGQQYPIDTTTGIVDEIDFSQNINLEQLYMDQCNIQIIDLSNCPNIKNIDLWYLYQISSLNLKNGGNENIEDITVIQYPWTPNLLTCIEVDDPNLANAGQPPYTPSVWHNTLLQYTVSEDCSALDVENHLITNNMVVYPNPTTDSFSINNNTEPILDINIYNQLGSLVKSTKQTKNINISNLSKGLYFLKIHTISNNNITKQLIKT